jgi:hypothetical protein
VFPIRMLGRQRLLEIAEQQIGERRIVGIVRSCFEEAEQYFQFYLKAEDKVYFDPKKQVIKLLFDQALERKCKPLYSSGAGLEAPTVKSHHQQKLTFSISSKNLFTLFIRKVKQTTFLPLHLIEFDAFDEREVDQRRHTILRRISLMLPKTQVFDVYSMVKGMSWKQRKLTKKLSLEPQGRLTIQWETEETTEIFNIADVHQIIWSDISQTSNPTVTFTFKDERKRGGEALFFEQETEFRQFLKLAQEVDSGSGQQRREMFIVKQSQSTKRKSRIMKAYDWFFNELGPNGPQG